MSKNAIIIYYDGLKPAPAMIAHIGQHIVASCCASEDSIVLKHYDEESIIKITSEDAIRKIVFHKKDEQQEAEQVKICFTHGPNKLQVVKLIKETFGLPLKEAKDAADKGVIIIPQTTDIYQFVSDLYANGGCIVDGGDERYAIAQAAVFINWKYPGNMQAENLVRDFAMAKYHNDVNAADSIERALLSAVQIVKEHPSIAQEWINPDLVKIITIL